MEVYGDQNGAKSSFLRAHRASCGHVRDFSDGLRRCVLGSLVPESCIKLALAMRAIAFRTVDTAQAITRHRKLNKHAISWMML
jgi:hypothetical protein